jgi:uracil phosphoribosyltransferase
VIEYALSCLPFETVSVKTPQGKVYEGKRCSVNKICGVSILRAGEHVRHLGRFSKKLESRLGSKFELS